MIDLDDTSRRDKFEEKIDEKLGELLTKSSSEELAKFCELYFKYEIYSYYKTLTNNAFTETLNTFNYLNDINDLDATKYFSLLDEHQKEQKKKIILNVITQIKMEFEEKIIELKTKLKQILQ